MKRITRQDIELELKKSLAIENDSFKVEPWMMRIGNYSKVMVFAYLFSRLKHEPYCEKPISSHKICNLVNLSRSNVNTILRYLNDNGFIYRRVDGKGCNLKVYYSLYKNLFNDAETQNA